MAERRILAVLSSVRVVLLVKGKTVRFPLLSPLVPFLRQGYLSTARTLSWCIYLPRIPIFLSQHATSHHSASSLLLSSTNQTDSSFLTLGYRCRQIDLVQIEIPLAIDSWPPAPFYLSVPSSAASVLGL